MSSGLLQSKHIALLPYFEELKQKSDSSLALHRHLVAKPAYHLERYFLVIQHWLNHSPNNLPLILQGPKGVGKKTILAKWQQLAKDQNSGLLIASNLASAGGKFGDFYYAVYRILMRMRKKLSINQRVQLIQQKLRRYFGYWLSVCSKKIQSHKYDDGSNQYSKIVLIFQGFDRFMQGVSDISTRLSFILPPQFPSNIRLIFSMSQGKVIDYFRGRGAQILRVQNQVQVIRTIMQNFFKQETMASQDQINSIRKCIIQKLQSKTCVPLMVEIILSFLVNHDSFHTREVQKWLDTLDLDRLARINKIQQCLEFSIEFWADKLMPKKKYQLLFQILVYNQNGVTIAQTISYAGVTQIQLKRFMTVHRSLFIHNGDLLQKRDVMISRAVSQLWNKQDVHQRLGMHLGKSKTSIRKVQQQTYQFLMSENYFRLKEIISDIENFVLLFNWDNKYDLCRYWNLLEQRSFDPVNQYNKSLQSFEMNYHIQTQQLFRFVLQISRFLKEFSDFQSKATPKFRHSQIVGLKRQISQLTLLQQFESLDMLCLQDVEYRSPYQSDSLDFERKQSRMRFREYFVRQVKKQQQKRNQEQFQQSVQNQYYFYKRWIWIQFPWACLHLKLNYSKVIKDCFSSPTDYMTVQKERDFYNQVLKQLTEAKAKKRIIFEKHNKQIRPIKQKSNSESKLSIQFKHLLSQGNSQAEKNSSSSAVRRPLDSRVLQKLSKIHKMKKELKRSEPTKSIKGYLPKIYSEVFNKLNNNYQHLQKKIQFLRADYDRTVNQNRVLRDRIQSLHINMSTKNQQSKSAVKLQLQKQIDELDTRLNQVNQKFKYHKGLKIRLQTLIYICKENKLVNQTYTKRLSQQSQILKTMIKRERQDISSKQQKIKQVQADLELKKSRKKQQSLLQFKYQKELQMADQIYQSFTQQLNKIDRLICVQKVEYKPMTQKRSTPASLYSPSAQQLQTEMHQYWKNQIQTKLGVDLSKGTNLEELQVYKFKLEKKREFQIAIELQQAKIFNMKKEIQRLNRQLKLQEKAHFEMGQQDDLQLEDQILQKQMQKESLSKASERASRLLGQLNKIQKR